MKYIVKNCPALIRDDGIVENGCFEKSIADTDFFCADRTDCPIKQIVEKCLLRSHILEVDDLKEEILKILQVAEDEK